MAKKIIVTLVLLSAFIGFSQQNTSSPYSYHGLGEVRFKGTADVRASGGLSFAGDSISLNLFNPASYSNLKFTSFGVGATSTFNKLSTSNTTEKNQTTALDYLAIGIPMGKFGATIGLMPYTAVGYKIQNSIFDSNNTEEARRYTGEGNINRFFMGAGYKINKNFNIGLDIQYNFGNVEDIVIKSKSGVQYSSRELNISSIKGLSYNFGLMFNKNLKDKLSLYSSFTFSPETDLNIDYERNIATVTYNIDGSENVINSQDMPLQSSKLKNPAKVSLGAGIGDKNKWLVGFEYTLKNSKNQNNRYSEAVSEYENAHNIAVGGFYIPKYDSYSSYFNKIVYRAGFRYENTGLILNNESITDYGMNFGLGLPLGLSKINIAAEFGKKGTTSSALIQENYFNLSVGLSLSDKWFRKRKID